MVKVLAKPSNKETDKSSLIPITGEVIFENKTSFRLHTSYETFLKKDFFYQRIP